VKQLGESMTEIVVPPEQAGERLDLYLSRTLQQSRAKIQGLLKVGAIALQPSPTRIVANYRLRPGDKVQVQWPEPVLSDTLEPEDIPLEILYEDSTLLVLNKPPGLVVHPAVGHRTGTLVHALLHHCRGQLAQRGGLERLGIVHRLDKDTSGALVIAKTDAAHEHLARQFHDRTVTKQYLALTWGVFRQKSGSCRGAIGRHPKHRQKMSVLSEGGRVAHTDYRVLQQGPLAALVECTLHTGRTHQIRVHLAHLGHPIVGDSVYGRARELKVSRQMLHAQTLGFDHPVTRQRMTLTAPLPKDFQVVSQELHVC
jgi:23S rRNA pseudouridine1911/1915/1917 synthase